MGFLRDFLPDPDDLLCAETALLHLTALLGRQDSTLCRTHFQGAAQVLERIVEKRNRFGA
jgi:hypothetical protein